MGWGKKVFGLDSFEGFSESVKIDIGLGGTHDTQKKVGGFSQTSYRYVRNKVKMFGLDAEVEVIKGFFQNSLSSLRDRQFSFVHLDCDLYESYKTCLEFFYPRMSRGGIILLDEYDDPPWPGCNKAVDEFLSGKLEKCAVIQRDNYVKYYIEKI